MKIIFLNLYSGKVERGAESFVHELAKRLGKKHKVIFIKGNSSVVSEHQFTGNLFQRWFNLKRFFLDTAGREIFKFTIINMPRILSEKPDWVIPMNGFWQVMLLKLIQPFVGFKILITGHSGPGWDERWNLYLHPNIFVATTKPTLEWAKKTCSWTKVELIPYGIDPSDFNPGVFHPGVEMERPVILCPSALVPYKRVELAIQAVARMDQGSLLILGDGPLKKKLKEMGNKLLERRFTITSVTYDRMPQMYASADVVTLPSSPQENSPMVYVEALAAEKPIVATDAPRVRWALEKNALYVDPTDLNSYAQKLKQATKHHQKKPKALEKFLWQNVLEKYENILKT